MTTSDPPRAVRPRNVHLAVAIAFAAVGATMMVLPSCEAFPGKTCFGDHANSITVEGGVPDPKCTSCLQTNCCDLVGYCDEEQGCIDNFKAAHQCVLEAGPGEESACIDRLGATSSRGRMLYDCMRERCGEKVIDEAPCRLSNCNLDPSVVLFANPSCDKCIGGSCCREINECYSNRRCKLAVECIMRDCRDTLGQEMAAFRASADPGAVRRAVCEDRGPEDGGPPAALRQIAGECVERCLTSFAPIPGTTDDNDARCVAFDVYACGARSECAGPCTEELDANVPPLEDGGPTDASAEAEAGAADASDGG